MHTQTQPDHQTIPIITPLPSAPGAKVPARSGQLAWLACMLGLVGLLVLVLGVVFVLPDLVTRPDPSLSVPAASAPAAPRPLPARANVPEGAGAQAEAARERDTAERLQAEAVLGRVLREKAALDMNGAPVWGEQDYAMTLQALAAADEHFARGEFDAARSGYESLLERFAELSGSKGGRLDRALEAGMDALAAAAGVAARERFDIALALDPGNPAAREGRQRAETIEQVVALHQEGLAAEMAGRLDEARERLRRAVELDGRFLEAREALARVSSRIRRAQFSAAMSSGLALLSRGDLSGASKQLRKARALDPDSAAVSDALSRLAAAVQARALSRHRQQAEAMASQERWGEAVQAYDAALALDPNLGPAREGREKALALRALNERIDGYLQRPQRLQSEATLAEARRLLSAAAGTGSGPRLQDKRARLGELVEVAQGPVEVLLRSDTHTEVSVQRVGSMGRFSERVLRLRPGRYTALGSRAGYRDVRVQFSVGAGVAPPAVLVRCEERV